MSVLGHKKPTDAQIQLVEVVRFFLEVNIHQHATYFVDSLWDHTNVIKAGSLAACVCVCVCVCACMCVYVCVCVCTCVCVHVY